MKTPKEITESVVPEAYDCQTPLDWQRPQEWLCRKISAAIQAERDANTPPAVVWTCKPPKGYVLTDEGVARRVLGELPVTADGCVIGDVRDHGAVLFLNGPGDTATPYRVTLCSMHIAEPEEETGWWVIENDELSPGAKRWFSTREAAEAAKKENT